MKNEYGVDLDRNGYAPSIYGERWGCEICGRSDRKLDRHEIFHGPNRTKSKNLGLWVNLCDVCHDELHHRGVSLDRELKEWGQKIAMEHYGWSIDEWRERFGKSWV